MLHSTICVEKKPVALTEQQLAKYFGMTLVDDILTQKEVNNFQWATSREVVLEVVNEFVLFFNLAMHHASAPICPTKKQDDVWHTLMLNPIAYYNFCMREAGRIIGHNAGFGLRDEEKIPALQASVYTKTLWASVYGEPHPSLNGGNITMANCGDHCNTCHADDHPCTADGMANCGSLQHLLR